jgi:transcriptional regulator
MSRHNTKATTRKLDQTICVLRELLTPGQSLTQEEIADCVGCTRQNIYQIEKKALRKIRTRLKLEKNFTLAAALKIDCL